MMKKMNANRMLMSALVMGALTLTVAASEMDPVSAKKATPAPDAPNVIVVQVDENGKETYYAGKTEITKDSIKTNDQAASKIVAEIVTDKNAITKPGTKSKDEMDQTSSTPQWFYIGFATPGFGIGWGAPCYYNYAYTWCPPAPRYSYRPYPGPRYGGYYGRPYHHGPRHHYRFYWC